MKQVTINTYTFDELSENAKGRARSWWREGADYAWQGENVDTLRAFERVFPVKVKDFEYGGRCDINDTITCETEIKGLYGIRLMKYIINNYGYAIFKKKYLTHLHGKSYYSACQTDNSCVLTGYCLDNDILEPIYKFLKRPLSNTTFEDILNDCLWAWVHACDKDYEYQNSDEYIDETIRCNEYTFTEDGKRF